MASYDYLYFNIIPNVNYHRLIIDIVVIDKKHKLGGKKGIRKNVSDTMIFFKESHMPK